MSLVQRLEKLEEIEPEPLAAVSVERSSCATCKTALPGFVEPYGPPNWHQEPAYCATCAAARAREILVAMEEAGFTPKCGIQCLARELGVTERAALELVRNRATVPAAAGSLEDFLVNAACVFASTGFDPLELATGCLSRGP